jgi:transcription elongation factor GreB
MSRWRQPQPKSLPYITAQGYRSLEAELRELWSKRSEATQTLTAAAAESDHHSKNATAYQSQSIFTAIQKNHCQSTRFKY